MNYTSFHESPKKKKKHVVPPHLQRRRGCRSPAEAAAAPASRAETSTTVSCASLLWESKSVAMRGLLNQRLPSRCITKEIKGPFHKPTL